MLVWTCLDLREWVGEKVDTAIHRRGLSTIVGNQKSSRITVEIPLFLT
jgi:hypothetical protein